MDKRPLLEKIAALQDLRHAIKAVQDHSIEKNDESQSKDVKSKPLILAGISHDTTDIDDNGGIHHILSTPDKKHQYKISVQFSEDKPQMIVSHIKDGQLSSLNSKVHKTIDSAVKSIMHHFFNKEWKE